MSYINMLTVFFKENMKYEKICALFEKPQKTVLPQGGEKTAPTWGKTVLRPHIFPGLIITV